MQPDQIKSIREAAKMTQQELATYLGAKSRSAVCRMEAKGKKNREPTGPQRRLLEILAKTLEKKTLRKSRK